MGVDYSAASGYGFEIPYEDVERIAERLEYPEQEWEFDPDVFAIWLVENYSGLAYDICGDYMSGEDMYIVIEAARVGHRVSMYSMDGSFRKFSQERVSDEQDRQLREVFERVYGREPAPEEIGWYMSTTVS